MICNHAVTRMALWTELSFQESRRPETVVLMEASRAVILRAVDVHTLCLFGKVLNDCTIVETVKILLLT